MPLRAACLPPLTASNPQRRSRRRALASAAVLAALLTACAPPPNTPDGVAEQFLRALGDKDTARACSLLAYDGRPLAGDDVTLCRSGFDALVGTVLSADELAQLRSATVSGASVAGNTASIPQDQIDSGLRAELGEIGLVRVDDRWYVDTRP